MAESAVALVPPGQRAGSPTGMKDGGPMGALIVTYTPSGTGLGKRLDIPSEGLTVGGNVPDLEVAGAQATGSRLEICWEGPAAEGTKAWRATAVGRVEVNREMVAHRMLDCGDDVRVVDTFFRFLCGSDLQDRFYETIYHLTILDMPTGLANPRFLREAMDREVTRAVELGSRLSVVALQFEPPKEGAAESIHDIVRDVGLTIRAEAPREWVFARAGNLEVVVVAPETSREDVERRARGWLKACDGKVRATTLGTAELGGAIRDATVVLAAARANATRVRPG